MHGTRRRRHSGPHGVRKTTGKTRRTVARIGIIRSREANSSERIGLAIRSAPCLPVLVRFGTFVAGQMPLELVTVAAPGVVHRTLVRRLVRVRRRRNLRVPISFAFLVRILIDCHRGLLQPLPFGISHSRIEQRQYHLRSAAGVDLGLLWPPARFL